MLVNVEYVQPKDNNKKAFVTFKVKKSEGIDGGIKKFNEGFKLAIKAGNVKYLSAYEIT
jgi:hypothetical protein